MGFWSNLCGTLFDFSTGQREGRTLERMLRVALAETDTEAEFYALLRRMLDEDDYLRAEYRWSLLLLQLSEHSGAQDGDRRKAAYRLADYLPRFYGYESAWHERP